VECGIFLPRFSIHSWNDDGRVNEPWMHESVTELVRDLIKFRARLAPYLYDLMWRSARDYEPIIRPTFFDFPDDPRSYYETDEMMLGSSLLVAPVVAKGQTERLVYLPRGSVWYDFWSGEVLPGGDEISVLAPWGKPPVFARAGSAIPVNLAEQHFAKPAHELGFLVFPSTGAGLFETTAFEDDGQSFAYKSGDFGEWKVRIETTAKAVLVGITPSGKCQPQATVRVILPTSEKREVRVMSGSIPIEVINRSDRA
jgi:alpha-glucosidase